MKTYLLFYLKINWLPCKPDLRIHSAEKNEKIVRMWHFSSKTTISSLLMLRYRMSHEIWQLIKFYKCRLLYTVLDITGFLLWINFSITLFPYYFCYCLWYQKTYQIMEEDIVNYSPIVMFANQIKFDHFLLSSF